MPEEALKQRAAEGVDARLGALLNRVRPADECEPWAFGVADLMRNLAGRGLL